ncbi:fimbrial biogenesis chaperone [Pseudomonas putida]|uniref:fimbrial biogenesis chaperone n=1 Tax=Pseudomonas putida TaxID=303 RepID=UPI002777CEAB|nr:molecular chaperone [Pseudomonas putida]MDP9524550.1 molecular chaperone [Pseudomonas putida]
MSRFLFCILSVSLFYFIPANSSAGVMAEATRVIYKEGQPERSLMIVNTNDYPVILQSWIDKGEGVPSDSATFIVTPPILRLAPKSIQGLRIINVDLDIPKDRESAFWLNLYEVPPTERHGNDQPQLSLAMNTQLKLFYRPKTLKSAPQKIARFLEISAPKEQNDGHLTLYNPTPYNISVSELSLETEKGRIKAEQQPDMMIAPFAFKNYKMSSMNLPSFSHILVKTINDAGFEEEVVLRTE